MAKAIKLIQRVLIIMALFSVVGCASINKPLSPLKELPLTSNVVIEEKSVNLPVVAQEGPDPIGEFILNTTEPAIASQASLLSTNPDATLAEKLADRFNSSKQSMKKIIDLATKYAQPDFPRKEDILALIAVESGYRIKAMLRGCYGLMQIERKSHRKALKGRSLYNPEVNIEIGANTLHEYFKVLGSKKAAVLAYNAGIGNFLKNRFQSEYYTKYKAQLALL